MHRLMMMLAAAAITVAGVLGQAAMAAGADPKIVRVGGYQFAPYVSFGEGGTGKCIGVGGYPQLYGGHVGSPGAGGGGGAWLGSGG